MATIVVGTNSYVTVTELTTYCTDRGIALTGTYGDETVILIKAMDYIESRSYSGKKYDEDQALQFPRIPWNYDEDEGVVPDKIKTAQIVAAVLIDSGVNLFATVGRAVKREKVDVLETEYMDNASTTPSYPQLDTLLFPFYSSGVGGFLVTRG